MNKKIFVWNINSATNRNIFIPDFVGEEIQQQSNEFIILTEFCKTKNYKEFIHKYLIKNGYNYIISNNPPKHNDILLAWNKHKYDVVKEEKNIITDKNIPNFAYVILKNQKGLEFVLAGVRITIETYDNRVNQLRFALNRLQSFSRVVIGGDFNCLRRKTSETKWNITVLSEISKEVGYKLITPEGQSIYAEKACCESYEFAEDHFVVKGIEIENEIYDRSFTDRNNNVYLHGRNFSVYNSALRRNIWSINVGTGIPDHAILRGNIYIENKTGQKDMDE